MVMMQPGLILKVQLVILLGYDKLLQLQHTAPLVCFTVGVLRRQKLRQWTDLC